ncbi:MAG: entericidin A/B family lipoprotein [Akkermansiaceae bacterium]|jgi:predicted small secreted protein
MKTLSLLILALASIALTSCNTLYGAGQDLQKGGQALTNAVRRSTN